MHNHEGHRRNRVGQRRPPWRAGALAIGLVALGLSTAACSSGSDSAGVASVSSSASAGRSSPAGGAKPSALAYAQCMQSHGVKNFPEPDSSGGIQFTKGQSLPDVNSPQFRTAAKACVSLHPAAVAPNPAQQAQQLAANVQYAKCMRSHGVPNFPDPGNDGFFDLQNIDVNSSQVLAANKACASGGDGIFGGHRTGA